MKICKSISAKFPTVQYGGVDVFCSVELETSDFPGIEQKTPQEQVEFLDQYSTYLVQKGWLEEKEQIEANLSHKFVSALSPLAEQEIVRRGLKKSS